MHGRTHYALNGFQVHTCRLAAALEEQSQKLLYFARDFLTDRFGRFFASGDKVSSTGRARQIFRLSSTNSPVSERNLRNSAISACALRMADCEGRFWVAVLPLIFCVS